jgi:hypothetical protein
MQDPTADFLKAGRDSLLAGVQLSRQCSYARRAPEPASLPHFAQARVFLDEVLRRHPDHQEALMMMSQLSENVLDFRAAIDFLERAFDVGEPKTKKSLKRLVRLRESAAEWEDLLLSPSELRGLGDYLEANRVGSNHRTLQLTRAWLTASGMHDPDRVIGALERRGAFSDFQVLANVVYG